MNHRLVNRSVDCTTSAGLVATWIAGLDLISGAQEKKKGRHLARPIVMPILTNAIVARDHFAIFSDLTQTLPLSAFTFAVNMT